MQSVKRVVKTILPETIVKPILPSYHLGRAIAANFKYKFPARSLKVVAVTGTNGKTTTAHYIASVLEAAGYTVGLSSTATFKVAKKTWDNELNMTVTSPFKLQQLFDQMKAAKVDWVVLEVTSHALIQRRIWGVPIHTAVMTNLTQDHLDYHQTMDEYAAAKAKLFKLAKTNVVLNRDDEWFSYFSQVTPLPKFSYGVHKSADVRLLKALVQSNGSKIKFRYGQGGPEVVSELKLPGKFNVYNALAAASLAKALEIDPDQVTVGLNKLLSVPGRMETIAAGQPFKVLVDYAHSPDAFKNLFETLKPLTSGRLIVVFGATGDRDQGKRPLMGSLAAKACDVVIITDDEPYSEDPAQIRSVVAAGARHSGGATEIIEIGDRHDAIARALHMAKPDDTVAILGMGHEKYRVIGTRKEPWDDREVTRTLLKSARKSRK